MTKSLSIKDINALRVLVKKMAALPPHTPEQKRTRDNSKRQQLRAEALAWAQKSWDEAYARIKTEHPACMFPEFGIGEKPTICTHQIEARYRVHINNPPGSPGQCLR